MPGLLPLPRHRLLQLLCRLLPMELRPSRLVSHPLRFSIGIMPKKVTNAPRLIVHVVYIVSVCLRANVLSIECVDDELIGPFEAT
jgi:hypothetical protein